MMSIITITLGFNVSTDFITGITARPIIPDVIYSNDNVCLDLNNCSYSVYTFCILYFTGDIEIFCTSQRSIY